MWGLRSLRNFEVKWKMAPPFGYPKTKSFQLQGGLRPPGPPTRGSAPGSRRGSAPRPPSVPPAPNLPLHNWARGSIYEARASGYICQGQHFDFILKIIFTYNYIRYHSSAVSSGHTWTELLHNTVTVSVQQVEYCKSSWLSTGKQIYPDAGALGALS